MVSADITDGTGTQFIAYAYDQDGIRVSETVDGQETRFLVDEELSNGQVVVEYDALGLVKAAYVVGLTRISQDRDGIRKFYLTDGIGSVRLLTDTNGTVTDRYNYDAFGQLINSTGSTPNRFLYTGEQFDKGLAAYYLRERHYQPSSGRFLSQDSVAPEFGQPQSVNRFVYALNDPANRTDPSGLQSVSEFMAAISIRNIIANFKPSALSVASGLVGASTGLAFFMRSHDPRKATAFVQGLSVSSSNILPVSASLGIDQLIPLKNRIRILRDDFPTVINIGVAASISTSPIPSPRIRSRRNRVYNADYEAHAGLIWQQSFPLSSTDLGTSVSYLRGGYRNGVSASVGGTISVGFPPIGSSSYGFVSNFSVTTNKMIKFIKLPTGNAPTRLTIPQGLSSQFAITLYVGDFPSFEALSVPSITALARLFG